MIRLLDYAPVAAACCAIPEFLPQLCKLAVRRDVAGVSWPWAVLTAVNNAAWLAYFMLSRDWTALIPSVSATLLAAALAVLLTGCRRVRPTTAVLIAAWAAALVCSYGLGGRAGLGTLLTGAFLVQVTPQVRAAYKSARPTGVSAGTWLLILGELSCWLVFGLYKSDPRLISLGASGLAASVVMLARVAWSAASTRR